MGMTLVIDGINIEIPRFVPLPQQTSVVAAPVSFTFTLKISVQDITPRRDVQTEERSWRLVFEQEFEIFDEGDPLPRRDIRKSTLFSDEVRRNGFKQTMIANIIGYYMAATLAERYSPGLVTEKWLTPNNLILKLPTQLSRIMKAKGAFREGICRGWDAACKTIHGFALKVASIPPPLPPSFLLPTPTTGGSSKGPAKPSPPPFPPPPDKEPPVDEPTEPPPPYSSQPLLPPLPPPGKTPLDQACEEVDRFIQESEEPQK